MLPDIIELLPLPAQVRAEVVVPGSKSITNRALICAALSQGEVELRGALWSEDTEVMVQALHALGFAVQVAPDPSEPCNRTLRVTGQGGRIPAKGGTETAPLELYVGNAGTAARFLAALVCLGKGVYRLSGVPRMHQRPQAALFDALRELGYQIDAPGGRLPALIQGSGPRSGVCTVSMEQSSQFASALLLCSRAAGWNVRVSGENAEESPYVRMTERLLESFPTQGGVFQIEPDASSGSYFWGAGHLMEGTPDPWLSAASAGSSVTPYRAAPGISVAHWPRSGWQIDAEFPKLLSPTWREQLGSWKGGFAAREISRQASLGDSIMTAIVLAPFWSAPTRFTELGRLRLQECERVEALRTELSKCGARVEETGDTLVITPSDLRGALVETYNDHRMAMCFAMLGLKVPGMRITNPACVNKTFPNFFQKLAAPPPFGLGCGILDAQNGRRLAPADLVSG